MGSKRVLIVEDDIMSGNALAYVLAREGCVTRTVRSGEEAVAAFRALSPDVVALDIRLSGPMDGYQVMEMLRAEAGKRTPIVIVTNMALQHEIARGRASGAADYLVKTEHPVQSIAKRLMEVA